MPHAMIFDAVRTPRGKGKKDGSLHEVKPVDLLAGLLVKLQKRHGFDPAALDDVVMGVVSPVGEQGSVIAKTAALKAGWDFKVAGDADQPLLRIGARGRQHRGAEGRERLGGPRRRRRRREHVARADRQRRRRLVAGPGDELPDRLRPAGHRRRPDRDARRLGSRGRRPLRADVAAARRGGAERGPLRPLGARRRRRDRPAGARARRVHQAAHDARGPRPAQDRLRRARRDGLRCGRARALSAGRAHRARPHGRQLVGHRRWRGRRADRQRGDGQVARPDAARAHRRDRALRRRPDDHADRADAGDAQGARQGRADDRRHRPVRGQRGVRRRADALHEGARRAAREGQRQRRRDRDGPPARRDRRDARRHAARRARAPRT